MQIELTYSDIADESREFIERPYLRTLDAEPSIIYAYKAQRHFFLRCKREMIRGSAGDYVIDINGFLKVIKKEAFDKKYSLLPSTF